MRLKQTLNVLTALLFVNIFSLTNTSNKDASFTVYKRNASENLTVNNNIQEYTKDNGEKRTIYWTKGIDAPLMAGDSNLGSIQDRYFQKESTKEIDGTYTSYVYPMENNKGYYDFNKNPHRTNLYPQQVAHHCYLASAMNLIYWWFDQNSSYIDQYIDLINSGHFEQDPQLRPINNRKEWESFRQVPQMEFVPEEEHYSMELSGNPLYKNVFKSFQYRDDGYWPNLVWDSFFNGFTPDGKDELYMPKSHGGLFYPIFKRKPVTQGIDMGTYTFFSQTVLDAIKAGNALSMSVRMGAIAHALTIWGVETDENGNLVRLYITDSDDYNSTEAIGNTLRGLHSRDVIKDINGYPRITTRDDHDPRSGSVITGVFILRLEQDRLETALNDLDGPKVPEIVEDLQDYGYKSVDEKLKTLTFNVHPVDDGTLTYQWYVSDDATSQGEKIIGATSASYQPTPINGKDKYYYCVVTNKRSGQTITLSSKRSRIFVSPDAKNALIPDVSYTLNGDSYEFRYTQFVQPKPLKVNVTQFDDGNLSYQWYKRDSLKNHRPTGGTPIPGEIYPIYYPKTNEVSIFDYYCIVTNTNENANGTKVVTTSPDRVLTIWTKNQAKLFDALPPKIVKQVEDQITFNEGDENPTLSIHANIVDGGYLSYQWYKANDEFSEGEPIIGATKPNYYVTNTSDTAYYYCKITNHNDSASNQKKAVTESNRCKFIGSGVPTLSDNAYLSSINLTNGSLSPEFDKNIYQYSLTLPINTNSTTITASKENSLATIQGDNQTVTLKNGESKTITIKVTAQDGSTTKTYTINVTRASTIKSITVNNTYTYDGEAQVVDLTVVNSKDEKLVLNKDYKIEYIDNNTNAGTVNFKVVGLNDYDGVSQQARFEIKKAELNKSNITITNNELTYNGEEQKPAVELDFNNKKLVKDADYQITYPSDNTNAGEKTLTITGKGNFDFTYTHTYVISKAQNSVSISLENGVLTGNATNGEVKYKYYSDDKGTKEIEKPSHNGTFYVKGYVEESDNYLYGESSLLSFIISNGFEKVDIKGSYVYDGTPKDIDLEIYNKDGDKLVLNKDYEISYLDNHTNAGTVRVKITGINDYVGVSKEVSFEIKKANNDVSIEIVDGEIKGNAANGNIVYKYYSDKEGKNEIEKPITPGTYYVKGVVDASDNYDYSETELIEYVVKSTETPKENDNRMEILTYSLIGTSSVILIIGAVALILTNRKKKL